MEVVRSPEFNRKEKIPVVLAIGCFDGIHLGHMAIINKTKELAAACNHKNGVYTFNPHPLKVIAPAEAPFSLISYKQKLNIFAELEMDYFFDQYFDEKFAQTAYDEFIEKILIDKINVSQIVIGKNFRFGARGEGNVDILTKYGKKHNFKVFPVDEIEKNGVRISSSKIRQMVKKGDIDQIPKYLGNHYQLAGVVIHGKGRGQKMGFPTANLKLDTNYILPPHGVYAGYVYHNEQRYKGVANFGVKPTFYDENYSIEIHILDINQRLYGERICFELHKFIRPEMTFKSPENLIKQVKEDILYTNSLLC